LPSGRLPIIVTQSPMTLGDRAAQELRRRQRVLTRCRPALRRPAGSWRKVKGPAGVGHVILGMQAPVAPDFAQLSGCDHLARGGQHRVAQVVEPDLSLHPFGFRRQRHLQRIGGEGRERFLAVDMFSGGNRRQRHFLVQGVRRRDRDQVDLGVRHDPPPI
jgi:hypothetical protein